MTPLATFCFSFLMVVEGGDKLVVDGGGPTKWGLSMMAARTKRNPDGTLTFDKNADGIINVDDVRLFTRADAERWFIDEVWSKIHGDEIHPAWAVLLSDLAFNAGWPTAVLLAQRALRGVKVDGIMGPKTLAALRESPGKALLSEFNGHRMNFYRRCPDVEVMFLGWATRASGALLLAVEKGKV